MYRPEVDIKRTLLAGEAGLLELISAGAPLNHVLDKISTALDIAVGNVVSIVFFPDDQEHSTQAIAKAAGEFGLSFFCCAAILSSSEELIGTLEMYGCFDRGPNASERNLIERAAELAALAIQSDGREKHSERCPWRNAAGGSSDEGPARN